MQDELTDLFAAYREACPDMDPSAGFLPGIWARIDQRQSFIPIFERIGQRFAAAAALASLLLIGLLQFSTGNTEGSYVDHLAALNGPEQTVFAGGR